MSLLWISAPTKRTSLCLLQEQPALLHCNGTDRKTPTFPTTESFFLTFLALLPSWDVQGRHMLKEDWCVCPHCEFPALHSQFVL